MPEALKITLNFILTAIPVAFLILAAFGLRHLFRKEEDPGKRALLVKRAGLAVMGAFASFVGAFAIGEPLADPGGWLGVGMVAAWFIPLVPYRAGGQVQALGGAGTAGNPHGGGGCVLPMGNV